MKKYSSRSMLLILNCFFAIDIHIQGSDSFQIAAGCCMLITETVRYTINDIHAEQGTLDGVSSTNFLDISNLCTCGSITCCCMSNCKAAAIISMAGLCSELFMYEMVQSYKKNKDHEA